MELKKAAMAGTLESSDAQVLVEPANTLTLVINSSVMNQYGRQIKATVQETLNRLGVTQGNIIINDKGALDCTLKARVECAVLRAAEASSSDISWGGMIR